MTSFLTAGEENNLNHTPKGKIYCKSVLIVLFVHKILHKLLMERCFL